MARSIRSKKRVIAIDDPDDERYAFVAEDASELRHLQTGIIPSGLRERHLEPFVSTKTAGTGLGLYFCSLLATLGGGTIAALATLGGGTTMRVELASVA